MEGDIRATNGIIHVIDKVSLRQLFQTVVCIAVCVALFSCGLLEIIGYYCTATGFHFLPSNSRCFKCSSFMSFCAGKEF
jgi:hypothetical protein